MYMHVEALCGHSACIYTCVHVCDPQNFLLWVHWIFTMRGAVQNMGTPKLLHGTDSTWPNGSRRHSRCPLFLHAFNRYLQKWKLIPKKWKLIHWYEMTWTYCELNGIGWIQHQLASTSFKGSSYGVAISIGNVSRLSGWRLNGLGRWDSLSFLRYTSWHCSSRRVWMCFSFSSTLTSVRTG